MILLIDNYDSFTFNLYQMIEAMGFPCLVKRNDEVTVEDVKKLNPSHIVISPGPGRPEDAGVILPLIKNLAGEFPILGVCLGHQAIALSFGGFVVRAPEAFHGKCSDIIHSEAGLFRDLPQDMKVARYHSLMVENLPACLEITAQTHEGIIMGIRHRDFPIEGVQFHPESFATEGGREMLENFFRKAA